MNDYNSHADRIYFEGMNILSSQGISYSVSFSILQGLVKFLQNIDNPLFLAPFCVEWCEDNVCDKPSLDIVWKDKYHDCVIGFFPDGYSCYWWIGIDINTDFGFGSGGDIGPNISDTAMLTFVECISDAEGDLNAYLQNSSSI